VSDKRTASARARAQGGSNPSRRAINSFSPRPAHVDAGGDVDGGSAGRDQCRAAVELVRGCHARVFSEGSRIRKSVEFDFDEDELRRNLREALFDGLFALVELDPVDLGVAWEGGEVAPHAFA